MRGTIDAELEPWIRDSLVVLDATAYRRLLNDDYIAPSTTTTSPHRSMLKRG